MITKTLTRFKRLAVAGAVTTVLASAAMYALPQSALAVTAPPSVVDSGVNYGPPSFADLAERVEPAVVSIAITGKSSIPAATDGPRFQMPQFPEGSPFGDLFRQFQNQLPGMPGSGENPVREFKAAGSGFIISPDGYVVTNNHVVDHATEIEIALKNGKRYQAAIKGRDPKTDLALLKVDADEALPYVELGNSDKARIGEWVVAVGNPFGLGGTVTAGIISARGRDIHSGPYDDYIQIDAPINRGNSGGPLFDSHGRVIGINSAIYSPTGGSVGIGFAIPSNIAKTVIGELKANGKVDRGWLGVQIQPITDDIAQGLDLKDSRGALVARVEPGSPAAHGGIRTGDVIVSLDGKELDDTKDLSMLVAATEAGKKVTVEVIRQGEKRKLEVEIGSMPTEDVHAALADAAESNDNPRLGVYLAELTPEARQRFHIDKNAEGVLVAGVQNGSPAEKAGIQVGTVIRMVGQEPVSSPQDVIERVKQAAGDKKSSVLLMVEQNGQQRFVAVKFAST